MYDESEADPAFADAIGVAPSVTPLKEMAASPETYFVKTHDLPSSDDFPALYLVRDGRDALVSYAHFILSFENKEPALDHSNFDQVLRELIVHKASFGGWGPHVFAWAEHRRAVTQVVKFEELIEDPVRSLTEALDAIGFRARGHNAESIPTFETLRELMPAFFRRGRVGAWMDEMSSDLHELFWLHHGDAMAAMDYEREAQGAQK